MALPIECREYHGQCISEMRKFLRRIVSTNKLLLTIRKGQLKFLGHNEKRRLGEQNSQNIKSKRNMGKM